MPKKCNLEGQRFGRLTVLERTGEREYGYLMWRCRCDCGGEIVVSTKRLLRRTVTNCGCVAKTDARRGPVAEDLTGRVFGRLTVLHRAEKDGNRIRWVCRCSCGNLHTVAARSLKDGRSRSCGCLSREKGALIVDITGQKFSRLTALHPTERRDGKGSVYWHCRCDCGKEVDITEDGLVHGSYRSCGCLRQEIRQDLPNQLHRIDGTCIERIAKQSSRSDNTSGFRGVYPQKGGKYLAIICFKRKRYRIGTFPNFESAVQARLEAEETIHNGFLEAYYAWQEKAEQDPKWAEENPLVFEVKKTNGAFHVVKA